MSINITIALGFLNVLSSLGGVSLRILALQIKICWWCHLNITCLITMTFCTCSLSMHVQNVMVFRFLYLKLWVNEIWRGILERFRETPPWLMQCKNCCRIRISINDDICDRYLTHYVSRHRNIILKTGDGCASCISYQMEITSYESSQSVLISGQKRIQDL